MCRQLIGPYISLECGGPAANPYNEQERDYGQFNESILINLGLSPDYSYEKGTNCLYFRVKRKGMNYFTRLALSAIIGVAVGVLGMFAPEGIRDTICTTAIIPLYETFYKLIGCAAGPMIFLSVTWGFMESEIPQHSEKSASG